jgi:hypothetical protein
MAKKVRLITREDVKKEVRGLSMQSVGSYRLESSHPEHTLSNDIVKLQAYNGKDWVDVSDWMYLKEMLLGVRMCISYTYREHRERERNEKLKEEFPEVAFEEAQDELYQKRRGEFLRKTGKRSFPPDCPPETLCRGCQRPASDVGMEVTPCCKTFICWDFCLYKEPKNCPFCKAPWEVVPKDPVTKESYIELLEKEKKKDG